MRSSGWILAAGLTLASAPAWAEGAAPSAEAVAEAATHFQRARQLYLEGQYKEALAELERARALDPTAKELVYNLGIVSEKLARYDDALKHFHTYLDMDLDAQERSRAETIVRRLEGAKRQADEERAKAPPPPPPPPPVPSTPGRGRIDAWTVSAGVVAVGGIAVGSIFGILATTGRPKAGFVTGKDGTYADLEAQADRAHTHAIVADVGFIVGLVAAAGTAVLYFARTKEPSPAPKVSIAPLSGGGFIGLGGRF
jgi:tetratricopeptide (TPR) repeat protein